MQSKLKACCTFYIFYANDFEHHGVKRNFMITNFLVGIGFISWLITCIVHSEIRIDSILSSFIFRESRKIKYSKLIICRSALVDNNNHADSMGRAKTKLWWRRTSAPRSIANLLHDVVRRAAV
jgi:hypothetical protein